MMTLTLLEFIYTLYLSILKLKIRIQLLFNKNNKNSKISMIQRAIKDALNNQLDKEEKKITEKIEERRKITNSSNQTLLVPDYGESAKQAGQLKQRIVGKTSRLSSKPYFWTLLLFKLVRYFKPEHCLELGTCFGISASYQASALQLNGIGEFTTIEGADSFADIAKENFSKLNIDNITVHRGTFENILRNQDILNKQFDFVFIDGHHNGQATIDYFNQILKQMNPGSLIIFDDISWSRGMQKAWRSISRHKAVSYSISLTEIGIVLLKD